MTDIIYNTTSQPRAFYFEVNEFDPIFNFKDIVSNLKKNTDNYQNIKYALLEFNKHLIPNGQTNSPFKFLNNKVTFFNDGALALKRYIDAQDDTYVELLDADTLNDLIATIKKRRKFMGIPQDIDHTIYKTIPMPFDII